MFLYLDFDSFFASAEQHFNPDLRRRPVGVVPVDARGTGCIAVSREAKALGLPSSISVLAARARIPDMIFVVARHDVYVRLHRRIIEAIETCVCVEHVRSIDEVCCRLTATEYAEGEALAARIKRKLAHTFSPDLTCSIGLGPTELLAKIAAERRKPDGLVRIEIDDLPACLSDLPLTKIPGISKGMETRLAAAGVCDFRALWSLQPKAARAIWRSVEGERFWNELHGLKAEREATTKRMFGHSRMLPYDWRTPDRIAICARQLCAGAARRLRRSDHFATRLTLSFRGGGARASRRSGDEQPRWRWERQMRPVKDDRSLTATLCEGLDVARRQIAFQPRSVSVMLHGLVAGDALIPDLFEDPARDQIAEDRKTWERVSAVMDHLRELYGPGAISLGPQTEMPGGYLGAKIAFGRIPDEADFRSAPVDDAATHFCTV